MVVLTVNPPWGTVLPSTLTMDPVLVFSMVVVPCRGIRWLVR